MNAHLQQAIQLCRAAGYRVTKPKAQPAKAAVEWPLPIFVARFGNGEMTRMSVWTSAAKPDVGRAERLARAAMEVRTANRRAISWPSPIVESWFEREGKRIAA